MHVFKIQYTYASQVAREALFASPLRRSWARELFQPTAVRFILHALIFPFQVKYDSNVCIRFNYIFVFLVTGDGSAFTGGGGGGGRIYLQYTFNNSLTMANVYALGGFVGTILTFAFTFAFAFDNSTACGLFALWLIVFFCSLLQQVGSQPLHLASPL